jgi:hypothetical protein
LSFKKKTHLRTKEDPDWAAALENWTAKKMATLKIRPTKKERKTKQKQQGSKENTETRRGKKEKKRAFPSSPAKPHKAEPH